jgi:predicted RNA binding protein YcfA (HicA-like mRNA interferase family)
MPKIPGVSQRAAIAALQKAGFQIIRQSGHVVMSDGVRILTIPRHNPINAYTMGTLQGRQASRPANSASYFNRYSPSSDVPISAFLSELQSSPSRKQLFVFPRSMLRAPCP